MQNRTFLLLFRPIFGEKLKTAPPKGNWVPKLWCRCRDSVWKSVWISDSCLKIRLNFGVDLFFLFFFFFFWRPHVFGLKNCLNFRFSPKNQTQFRWRPFFFFGDHLFSFREIPSQISDKPCETDSRIMKIRVKFLCTFHTLSKKPTPPPPPPFSKSWLRAWSKHIINFFPSLTNLI